MACTTPSILCEVYGALTWEQAQPVHAPHEASQAVRLLVEPPSSIRVLSEGLGQALSALDLAAEHGLRARRIHDARHAAVALASEVRWVCTYDPRDWLRFEDNGLAICGPESTLAKLDELHPPPPA